MLDAERFLKEHEPFQLLPPQEIKRIVHHLLVRFYPEGEIIFGPGSGPLTHLHIVRKGTVILTEGEKLIDFLHEGDCFGFISLMTGDRPSFTARAYEDALLFLLPDRIFHQLRHTYPQWDSYFTRKILKRFDTKYRQESSWDKLLEVKVKDLGIRPVPILEPNTSLKEAVREMLLSGQRCALTKIQDEWGILTERDVMKAVEEETDIRTPVEKLATVPIIGVEEDTPLLEALTVMTKHGLSKLVVFKEGIPTGVIEERDILYHQVENSPLVFKEIERAESPEELHFIFLRITERVINMATEGVDPEKVGLYISQLNDRIMRRSFLLTLRRIGEEPPSAFSLVVLGSEGRQEQTLKTDQDNALLYRVEAVLHTDISQYYALLGEEYIKTLIKVGFPPCQGDVMISHPDWRGSYQEWEKRIRQMASRPEPQNALRFSVLLDMRHVMGDAELTASLRDLIFRVAKDNYPLLRSMAQESLRFKPPITFFKNLVVESTGEHRGELDIKKGGIFPVVQGVRVLSLLHDVREQNTYSRIRQLEDRGALSRELATDLLEAYRFMNSLRLRSQALKLREGKRADNYINPSSLSKWERNHLKDAFRIVEKFQEILEGRFP
ncbi:putative CBS domain and cyclic nucleotide- regulated nucleotidyltransferase [Thermocrinis albus DSM 14484]|uniref:Putative CBS domain and cyclic nucleotide-regulated nucleotidyltransferase n=2 Tax=Thermocrinis TaxID=75905 RepID=D3SQH5_THEAH|nr:putative CBS domain and cyclic nucleotide- regulated nucleotidyltransferase [Thermocrinis albus DSM 14484]